MTLPTTQISSLVADVGFPIGAFWLMYHMSNGSIKELRIAVEKLTLIITEKLK